jgi:hypothetical protein
MAEKNRNPVLKKPEMLDRQLAGPFRISLLQTSDNFPVMIDDLIQMVVKTETVLHVLAKGQVREP